jgi:cytochrome c-type biogenesis protein CcmF
VSPGRLARVLALPLAIAAATLGGLVLATSAAESPLSLAMFCLVAFMLATVGQEFWRGARARAVISGRPAPAALVELVVRNRRRYGGYVVHAGIALLFLGAAASSAFKQQTDVRLRPGESARLGDYRVTYRQATARLADDPAGTGAPITLGALLELRDGSERFELRPARNYYPGRDPALGAIARFFEGDATSEVAQTWGLDRDVSTAVQPDLAALRRPIRVGQTAVRPLAGRRAGHRDRGARGALQAPPGRGELSPDRLSARGLDLRRRQRGANGRTARAVAGSGGAPAQDPGHLRGALAP